MRSNVAWMIVEAEKYVTIMSQCFWGICSNVVHQRLLKMGKYVTIMSQCFWGICSNVVHQRSLKMGKYVTIMSQCFWGICSNVVRQCLLKMGKYVTIMSLSSLEVWSDVVRLRFSEAGVCHIGTVLILGTLKVSHSCRPLSSLSHEGSDTWARSFSCGCTLPEDILTSIWSKHKCKNCRFWHV